MPRMPNITPYALRSLDPRAVGTARNSTSRVLALILMLPLCGVALRSTSFAQTHLQADDLSVLKGSGIVSEEMLADYLNAQARAMAEKCRARLGSIRSEADLAQWQEESRKAFLTLIGGLPGDRTPLNARVVGEVSRSGYLVRKVIFESLPEFYVTANLYVPTEGKPPYPAVLLPIGHSRNGKAYATYQNLYIGLAKRGYVVLTWDPVGQGERVEYWDFLNSRRRFEFNQHGMEGIQEYLLGQNLARYFIWDGMRALDYLCSLKEVDASRIGVTGSSGGGTLSTYLAMLDPRIKVASIVTFISSLPWKIQRRINDAESDPEQDIQGLLPAGIDHPEFIAMIAPRPVQIGAATQDFFPIEGTRETYKEVAAFYARLGIPERVKMVEFNHRHMYSQPLREATIAWFNRWLKGQEGEVHEPPITTEPDAALECTKTGLVVTSLSGKRVADFNRAEADRLLAKLRSARQDPGFRTGLAAKLRARLALPEATAEPSVKKLGESTVAGLTVEKLLLESEPGVMLPVRVISPSGQGGRLSAVLYLRDRTGEDDSTGLIESLARQGRRVVVADVRGFGETMSPRNVPEKGVTYFDPRDGMDADFSYASFFIGRPLLGMRVADALVVLRYLRSRDDVDAARIGIVGRGWAGMVALFAAGVDPQISWAALAGIPASYGKIASAKLYAQPVSLMLPGALQDSDLQDVLATLAPRPLLVANPTDALVRKLTREAAAKVYEPVRAAYREARAPQAFEAQVVPIDADLDGALGKWIGAR
jgi:cephalosporin-C deacetylase-like acetyl esterase